MPVTNDPYSRPIGATRPGAVLVGEHYGVIATDTRRAIIGRNQHAAAAIGSTAPYEPVDSAVPLPVFERVELAYSTPNPEPTSPSLVESSLSDDEVVELDLEVPTEDDLFG